MSFFFQTGIQIGLLRSSWPTDLLEENLKRNEYILSLAKSLGKQDKLKKLIDPAQELIMIPNKTASGKMQDWLDSLDSDDSDKVPVDRVINVFAAGLQKSGSPVLLDYIKATTDPNHRERVLLRELSRYYPATTIFPIASRNNTMELLKQLCQDNILVGDDLEILQATLNSECRFLMAVIEQELKLYECIRSPLKSLILDILEKLELPLKKDVSCRMTAVDEALEGEFLPERPTCFFPNYPRIRSRPVYGPDVQNAGAFIKRQQKVRTDDMNFTEYLDEIELEDLKCKNSHSKSKYVRI